jgi:enamine deaminase RidA (YjgF/YER057c/UK114 family)
VDTPTYRKLFISGTASIAPEGHTVHLDDIDQQIELTLDVVLAIMESCGMEWNDVTGAIAYVRDKEDLPAFDRYCERTNLSAEPVVVIQNDVCREDLLFELELAAAKAKH